MKKFFAAIMAVALAACLMAAPTSAITTGKWEISQGTQDLIDKTLDEVPEYQPEAEKPDCRARHWAKTIRHIMQHWFDRWDRWDVIDRE